MVVVVVVIVVVVGVVVVVVVLGGNLFRLFFNQLKNKDKSMHCRGTSVDEAKKIISRNKSIKMSIKRENSVIGYHLEASLSIGNGKPKHHIQTNS